MGCANLAYLTRNPFRFFECFPNFSRTLPPNGSRFLTEIFRVLVELFSIFQECSRKSFVLFPSFPEIFRAFSDFFEYFSKSIQKLLHIFGIYFPHMIQGTSTLSQIELRTYRTCDKFFCKVHGLGDVVPHREI